MVLAGLVGDGALLVDPTPDGIAQGIVDATSGDPATRRLAARGRERASEFTWERSLRSHAEVWASVAD